MNWKIAMAALAITASASATAADLPQQPGYYRAKIGNLNVTALFDGVVPLPLQQLSNVPEASKRTLNQSNFVPVLKDGMQTAVNAYVVQKGGQTILVDTGTAQCFGPGLGYVLENMRAAAIDPADVDVVLLTHAHPDHLCGLLDGQGKVAFANATVMLSKEDADYWLNPKTESTAPQALRFAFPLARTAVAPYQEAGRLKTYTAATFKMPGITAMPSHGHTVGHTSYLFDGGKGSQLLVWGDIVHYHAVQFAIPSASYEADTDRQQAIATRRNLMKQATDRQWWVAGAHLPFPGLGHIGKAPTNFRWIPAEYTPL